ncbi:putative G patch domain-containing protein [Helianthus annuus]|nr:putative G patch domain-containing protein [Helianthus annuus]
MADEDDDYMGDLSKFLSSQPETSTNPPAKKVYNTSSSSKSTSLQPSKKRQKTLNWQQQRKQKREIKQAQEDEQTLASLESAIPQSNIGFKMLKQMGYTPGSGLGGSGRVEPVGVEIRRSRAGIGREDPIKEKMRREEELGLESKRREEELMADFGCRVKERWRSKRVVVNFYKAKGVLDQLENKEVVELEKKDDDDDGGDEEEEEEEVITEEDLHEILMKLRDNFHYCLFCGCQYESMDALLDNCPGINEDDH